MTGIMGIMLLCPVCGGALAREEHAFVCPSGHTYDIAASGYCNLLRPGRQRNKTSGDDRDMVRARSEFLGAGYYSPVLDFVAETVGSLTDGAPAVMIDAGCGEGFYTNGAAARCPSLSVLGIDVSKHAVDAASKGARREGVASRVMYVTASSASMPVPDGSADIVLSIFSPCAYGEFARVLKDGGHVLICSAGASHLREMKEILYGRGGVRPNIPIDHASAAAEFGLVPVMKKTVSFRIVVEGQAHIKALFSMTPYRWRTPREGTEALALRDELDTAAEFDITLLQKQSIPAL